MSAPYLRSGRAPPWQVQVTLHGQPHGMPLQGRHHHRRHDAEGEAPQGIEGSDPPGPRLFQELPERDSKLSSREMAPMSSVICASLICNPRGSREIGAISSRRMSVVRSESTSVAGAVNV